MYIFLYLAMSLVDELTKQNASLKQIIKNLRDVNMKLIKDNKKLKNYNSWESMVDWGKLSEKTPTVEPLINNNDDDDDEQVEAELIQYRKKHYFIIEEKLYEAIYDDDDDISNPDDYKPGRKVGTFINGTLTLYSKKT